jgi:nitroimidazol reductase NimA-like FMN-containing flavoprotein (pyridoxamine 5'-phosphate oxidase superfamily)
MTTSPTPQERAKRLIDESTNMVLTTADSEGVPWVSPVFYVADDDYDLYWTSDPEARHSANLRVNPRVAIVIFDTGPVDAVYISARAVEINDINQAIRATEIMRSKAQPPRWVIDDLAVVVDDGPWRIYRATPETIEVRAETIKGGKPVVIREDADFRA